MPINQTRKHEISMISAYVLLSLVLIGSAIQIPIAPQQPTCMVMMANFEPIKVQARFPKIPRKQNGQVFRIEVFQFASQTPEHEDVVEQGSIFRKNYDLQINKLYQICFHLVTERVFKHPEQLYISYLATQDFESLIGRIDIPSELSQEVNLKTIYNTSRQMTEFGKIVASHQQKQRQLEEKLVEMNLHKNQRIVTLTLIECLVIVLSGVYQVFALRKFLIEKNLY